MTEILLRNDPIRNIHKGIFPYLYFCLIIFCLVKPIMWNISVEEKKIEDTKDQMSLCNQKSLKWQDR